MGFCGENKTVAQDKPQWFDPLGPTSIGRGGAQTFAPSGAIPLRNNIFNYLGNQGSTITNYGASAANAAQGAAGNYGFRAATDLANNMLSGKYLSGSPYLEKALGAVRQGTLADLSGAVAGQRSQMNRAGLDWSTANQEAADASRSATMARLGEGEQMARLQNYTQERNNQNVIAPQLLQTGVGAPLNYLNAASSAATAPLAAMGNIISGLAGNGQIARPESTVARQPGVADYMLGAMQAVGGNM